MTEVVVGVVVPRSGRLRRLADPVTFVLDLVGNGLRVHGRPVTFAVADSRSDPVGAREAVRRLADRASVVLTLGGTQALPAVAAACEELRVPCVSTTLPWQVYRRHRAVERPEWSFHFCWGIDDIAGAFADLWSGNRRIGCLWNDGAQGTALRDPVNGFAATAQARGHELVDPGGYRESASTFAEQVDRFLAEDVRVVTAAATAEDLAAFADVAARRGLRTELITCSRWLSYPFGAERAGLSGIGTIVAWSPRHPHRSSLDGLRAAELASAYEQRTGDPWLQPLGLAHALVEVAVHAVGQADDPADRAQVAEALRHTALDTIAGRVDWTTGPAPGIARIPLTAGKWLRRDGRMELRPS